MTKHAPRELKWLAWLKMANNVWKVFFTEQHGSISIRKYYYLLLVIHFKLISIQNDLPIIAMRLTLQKRNMIDFYAKTLYKIS